MVGRQFSRDIEARLEMNMVGEFYHGRRIHYSGGSFKMRARSKSEVSLFLTFLESICKFQFTHVCMLRLFCKEHKTCFNLELATCEKDFISVLN
jgi:hypothetical protein